MESKRHHILPRFLLEGFASRKKNREVFANVFTPGKAPYETNTKNIAVEQHFYGKDGAVERLLARQESDAAAAVQSLRAGCPGPIANPARVSRFVALLIARTRHVRDSFNEVATEGVDKLLTRMDELGLAELARRYVARHPSFVPDMLRRVLGLSAEEPLPPNLAPRVTQLFHDFIGRQDAGAGLTINLRKTLEGLDVGKPQNDALLKIDGGSAPDSFAGFTWETLLSPKETYILGDLGPIGIGEDGGIESPLSLGPKLTTVVLPVSSALLLVGTRGSSRRIPPADELNRASAELAREFFVAASLGAVSFQSVVGVRGRMLSSEDLDRVVNDVIDNL